MTVSAKERKEQRAEVAAEMKKLLDTAEGEERAFTTEEDEKWKGYEAKIEELDSRIERQEKLEIVQSKRFSDTDDDQQRFDEQRRQNGGSGLDSPRGGDEPGMVTPDDVRRANRYFLASPSPDGYPEIDQDAKAFRKCGFNPMSNSITLRYDRGTDESGSPLKPPKNESELRYHGKRRAERRAQAAGTATAGGHTVPDEMMHEIERARLFFGGMRSVAQVMSTGTGADLPWPTVNDTNNQGAWIGENSEMTNLDITFGQVVLKAYKAGSRLILISLELAQDSATNMNSLIGSIAGERIARLENQAFTIGTGVGQPTGIVTAAADSGITLASNTTVTFEEMVDVEHSVDIAYRSMGRWMFHDDVCKFVKKLKDAEGRPLWLPSISVGEPDTILNYPFTINNDMPTGASAKGILFGDLSKYKIRETMSFELQRLVERYAEFGQICFLAWARCDGNLIDAGTGPVKFATFAA